MTVASAKVGEYVGGEGTPENLAQLAQHLKSVSDANSLSDKQELLMVVAVDALGGFWCPAGLDVRACQG
eukprot:6768497-Pyramimonas_sp.AAC.1